MPQYLVANYLPDDFDPSAVTEAMIEEIHALNREMIAAGARKFACGISPASFLPGPEGSNGIVWPPQLRNMHRLDHGMNEPAGSYAAGSHPPGRKRRRTVKYLCFGYYDKGKFDGMTEAERNAMFDTCFEYDDHLRASGHWAGRQHGDQVRRLEFHDLPRMAAVRVFEGRHCRKSRQAQTGARAGSARLGKWQSPSDAYQA